MKMNNADVYIAFSCDDCGQYDYNIKICSKCKKKYCRYNKCADKIVYMNSNLICRPCVDEKLK